MKNAQKGEGQVKSGKTPTERVAATKREERNALQLPRTANVQTLPSVFARLLVMASLHEGIENGEDQLPPETWVRLHAVFTHNRPLKFVSSFAALSAFV